MASAGPFGGLSQAGAAATEVVEKAEDEFETPAEKKSSNDAVTAEEKRQQNASTSSADDETDSSIELKKAVSKPEVQDLARHLTLHSIRSEGGSDYANPFVVDEHTHPQLDPDSKQFKPEAWLRTLIGIQSRDPERYPQRTAGVSFKNLSAHGFGSLTDYQKTFGNYPLSLLGLFNKLTGRGQRKIQILRDFEGVVHSGEMLVVLGRPGSGCSTFLKTIAGETAGFHVDPSSSINYQGIPSSTMHKDFRGECIYQAENDVHFPRLTVGQTLQFAAEARAPENRLPGVSRKHYAEHMTKIIMAVFGLSHTYNTLVGNDFVRGVSGGERKRVSIAEAALGQCPLQCWDNSTRGLDSATALEFVRTLRLSTSLCGTTAIVAIYQASQSIFDVFDKVVVLYEGRQIYFGPTDRAKAFFTEMGFVCAERATTGDFLTSLTNPSERVVRPGFEARVPRSPDEFAARWQGSEDRAELLRQIAAFDDQYPLDGDQVTHFRTSRMANQAKYQRRRSPYTISLPMQVKLCLDRGFQRLRQDFAIAITTIVFNSLMALIVASVFYNLKNDTSSFFSRGALIFFAILLSAFGTSLEVFTLFAQRPIVEKHVKYAFYHPAAESLASMLCDFPNKLGITIFFTLTIYFLADLRRTPAAYFTYFLFSFICMITMSMMFRFIGSTARTFAAAQVPTAILILALIIYTGFALPVPDMHPWFRWLNYLNPVAYAFEALMINEFHNRRFPCASYVPQGPAYMNVAPDQRICNTVGAIAGQSYVSGDDYLQQSYQYRYTHLWRNLGILFGEMVFFFALYMLASETVLAEASKGEILLFRRGFVPSLKSGSDEESAKILGDRPTAQELVANEKTTAAGDVPASIQKQTAIFHFKNVTYDIKIKKEGRRILDGVDGWIKPGTLTALMGATGAGKTTLLDVLASRVTMGIVSGQIMVNGRQRDSGFQRKTGYVQQQDIHLATSTVREALSFSALLRQPRSTPRKEKLAYVEEVIGVLEMESYADAVVGVPGEGLNVEQRKRLTIGVELAAKPALLLFLDEPTSGLDSQTAWSIIQLLRKLAHNGQAILCTIHQPSAILFQEFDRLLFLVAGGKTVYFGDIGKNSKTLTDYFRRNGSRACGVEENPAEWMLDVVGAAPGSRTTIDWPQVWRDSEERIEVRQTLEDMRRDLSKVPVEQDPDALQPFAQPLTVQLRAVLQRIYQQYWRTPAYLYSKTSLCLLSGLFIGFSFYMSPTSLQGLQNQLFSIFMLLSVFNNIIQQIMPLFVVQRELYEARERPSKTYDWRVFMLSNILVELPWNTLMSVLVFVTFYYPVGMYRNAIPFHQEHVRGALMFLYTWMTFLVTSTLSHALIAGIPAAEMAGNLGSLLFTLSLIFCGVLATPSAMPRFWIFMYRVSPFTYVVDGFLSVGLANQRLICSDIEYKMFNPPAGSTCGTYLNPYISYAGGYVQNPDATTSCQFCPANSTNTYLTALSSSYSHRWRNFGILWAYVFFNIAAALFFYWLARVPRKQKVREEATEDPLGLTKSNTRVSKGSGLIKRPSAGSRRATEKSSH